MPRIYVEFDRLKELGDSCKTVSSKVDGIKSDFQRTVSQLDWDVKYESDINNTAKQLAQKLDRYVQALKNYQSFISEAYDQYVKLDNEKFDEKMLNVSLIINSESSYNDIIENLLKNVIIGSPYAIPALLSLVSPIASLLYITSGIPFGSVPSFLDSSRTASSNASADWLGYKFADGHPGVTAWLGKAGAEAQNEWGYAGVNAYLGKVDANADAGFSFMSHETKKEYLNGQWTEKPEFEILSAAASAGASASILAADAKAGVGSDMLGVDGSAEGGIGNATAEAKGKLSIGEDGINANVEGKAMVSAAEGKAKASFNLLGIEISGSVGGYAGALGAEGKIGIENNKWVMEGGVAALLGVSAGVEIGFNDEGWSNFVDFATFWD